MAKYIDKDKAYGIVLRYGSYVASAKIADMESIELVRCGECKWWDKPDDSPYGYCNACKHGYYSEHWEICIYRRYEADWFCADGERKVQE